MIVAEIDITPIHPGQDADHFSQVIAHTVKILDDVGARYRITPFGTVVEGELDEVLDWLGRMHRAALAQGCERVLTQIKIDERKQRAHPLEERVEVLERRLGHSAEREGTTGERRGHRGPVA